MMLRIYTGVGQASADSERTTPNCQQLVMAFCDSFFDEFPGGPCLDLDDDDDEITIDEHSRGIDVRTRARLDPQRLMRVLIAALVVA